MRYQSLLRKFSSKKEDEHLISDFKQKYIEFKLRYQNKLALTLFINFSSSKNRVFEML